MAADALDVLKMNVNPGGKQSKMRDTIWEGKPQKLCFNLGVPKGMKQVLKERGINTDSLNAEKMREILKQHDDFKNEKPSLITFLESEAWSLILWMNAMDIWPSLMKSLIEHRRQTHGLKNKHDVYSSTANPRKDIGLAKNS